MKVRSLDNNISNNSFNNTAAKKPGFGVHNSVKNNYMCDTVSFGSMNPTTFMIDFWAAMARGGLAASFTVQDMLGTNFPRTFAALDRNKDITGKNNYKAAVEVVIREFTTGPSMFIVPAIVLGISARLSGEANRIPTQNIASLSTVMKNTIHNLNDKDFNGVNFKNLTNDEAKEAAALIKKTFYKDVFTSIFEQYDMNGQKVDIDKYVELMLKAEDPNTPKRNFFKSMFNKKVLVLGKEADSKDEVLTQLASRFVADKKAHTTGWGNFLNASVVKGGTEYNISDIITDMKNYSDDFAKQYITAQRKNVKTLLSSDAFINKFKDLRIGSRAVTNVMMVVATGLFMSIIPKLYTRNKTNPETDAIYAQVNQQRRGAVNENK